MVRFLIFPLFGRIHDLGGRGSILATGTTKIKLLTPNLDDNTQKLYSLIKCHQKSGKHHNFVYTKTDMQF